MTEVQGVHHALRMMADRLHGDVDGISKEALIRFADKVEQLERVANVAANIVDDAPVKGDGAVRVMVSRRTVIELMRALQEAGKRVKALHV